MRAVILRATPEGGVFEVTQAPDPVINEDQVLVRVRASGLNRGELITRANYRAGPPIINGIEYAGEVAAVGAQVEGFKVGDRVMGHGRQSMAELVATAPRALMPIPEGMGFAEAAAFPNVFVTAHDALITNGSLKAGESVLINASSSGIGTAAVQIARVMGAGRVIGASRSAAKLARVAPLGLTHQVATDDQPLPAAVLAATDGQGADIVIDSLGGPVLDDNLRSMALEGRLVSVGRTAGTRAELDLDWLSLRRLRIIGVTFRTRSASAALACVEACARDLLPFLRSGAIRPVVDACFPLEQLGDAHRRMESNAQVGKIIMLLD